MKKYQFRHYETPKMRIVELLYHSALLVGSNGQGNIPNTNNDNEENDWINS